MSIDANVAERQRSAISGNYLSLYKYLNRRYANVVRRDRRRFRT